MRGSERPAFRRGFRCLPDTQFGPSVALPLEQQGRGVVARVGRLAADGTATTCTDARIEIQSGWVGSRVKAGLRTVSH
jgi:hypothetical protein